MLFQVVFMPYNEKVLRPKIQQCARALIRVIDGRKEILRFGDRTFISQRADDHSIDPQYGDIVQIPLDRDDTLINARFPVMDEGGVGAVDNADSTTDGSINSASPDLALKRGDYDGDDAMVISPESTLARTEAKLLMHDRYKMLSRAHGCNITALLQGGIFGIE
jgi:hypothetical protein